MDKWGVLGCGWGDTIVSLTNLKKNNIRKVLYLGSFPEIVELLKAQDFIDEVEFAKYTPKDDNYWSFFFWLAIRKEHDRLIIEIVDRFGLDKNREFINCQLAFGGGNGELELIDHINFSESAIEEATRIEAEYNLKDFIIFQPVSLHSTPPENFYPYWDEAFKKTLETYPDNQIVLIGLENKPIHVDHPKFIDLRNKFKSAESIGYLAKKAKLVVTLSNNLIYFCHIFDVPTVNLCNKEFDFGIAFRRSMTKRTMINIDWRAPVERAYEAIENYEKIIEKNQFHGMIHDVDFLSKFHNIHIHDIKKVMDDNYYLILFNIYNNYSDKDWFFAGSFPWLAALYGLYFNQGTGCTEVSTCVDQRFMESYNFLTPKTTMLRRCGEIGNDVVVFITSEDLLRYRDYAGFDHLVIINNSRQGLLDRFLEENNFEFTFFEKPIYDARKI